MEVGGERGLERLEVSEDWRSLRLVRVGEVGG